MRKYDQLGLQLSFVPHTGFYVLWFKIFSWGKIKLIHNYDDENWYILVNLFFRLWMLELFRFFWTCSKATMSRNKPSQPARCGRCPSTRMSVSRSLNSRRWWRDWRPWGQVRTKRSPKTLMELSLYWREKTTSPNVSSTVLTVGAVLKVNLNCLQT